VKNELTTIRRIFLLFLSAMMLCMANVPLYAVAIIPDGIIEENLDGEDELMPMGASDCPDGDQYGYTQWKSLNAAMKYYGSDFDYEELETPLVQDGKVYTHYYLFSDGSKMYLGVMS
jgi:hypothetical protein